MTRLVRLLRAFIDVAILIGVISGALLSVAGLLGLVFPLFDIINHFQLVFLLLVCISYTATFLWPFYYPSFQRYIRLLLLIPLAVSLLVVGPEAVRQIMRPSLDLAKVKADGHLPLKVMSFNIWLENWDRPGTARSILRHDPDIVLLQEYAPNRYKRQKALKKRYPYQARCGYWRNCTLAILSKYPLKNIKNHFLAPKDPTRPIHGKMLSATLKVKGYRDLRLYTLHTDWPKPFGDQRRQFGNLVKIMEKERAKYRDILLAGDFNSSGWSFELNGLSHLLKMDRHSLLLPSYPSFNRRFTRLRIPVPAILSLDHIFASRSVPVGYVSTVSANVSDHRPVVADIVLEKK